MAQLTDAEMTEIIEASLRANAMGDREEEHRLLCLIPLAPHLAKAAKEMYGKEFLIEEGYDLSDADMEFGDGWLEN
jgi:hypothetical protein